jgi:NADP-dependent 3-hydroxy acid dehydrogenase YdfG
MTTTFPFHLNARHAVVVGATGGIGSGVCRALLAGGASVALVARDMGSLRQLEQSLDAPQRTFSVSADVTDTYQLAQARDAILERFGAIDLVVISTGIMVGSPFEEAIPADWVSLIDVNLHGLLYAAQTFSSDLIDAASAGGPSDLVLIGSIGSHIQYPNFSVFNAVSAAIAQLSRTLRSEYGRRGLRVHNIEPGFTRTTFGRNLRHEAALQHWRNLEETINPLDPDDLGRIVALTAAMPAGLNIAEMVVIPTEQE